MKNTLALRCIALALMGGMAAAHADWQPLGREGNKVVEYDLQRAGGSDPAHPDVWSRLSFNVPAIDPISGREFHSIEMLSRFDCRGRQVSTLERIYRDHDGNVVRDEEVQAPGKADVAGGAGERLFNAACKSILAEGGVKGRAGHADYVAGKDGRLMLTADSHTPPVEGKVELHGHIDLPPIKKPINPEMIPPAAKSAAAKPAAEKPAAEKHASNPEHAPSAKTAHLDNPLREIPVKRRAKPKPKEVMPAPESAHPTDLHPHWSYEGETGPQFWGKINPAWATCGSGKVQSPIDIRGGIKVDVPPITFDYRPSLFSIVDNGHTVQVNYGEGSSLTVQGRHYDLVQFHFHSPSEERINGRNYEMVAHLVHKDYEGHLAVVAVLFERGKENPFIQTLWDNLPLQQNSEVFPPDTPIDLSALLPQDKAYYTFMGSLTTPPCTEGVLWMVLKKPVQVSDYQLAIFRHLYKNNVRPVQPGNSRLIKESR